MRKTLNDIVLSFEAQQNTTTAYEREYVFHAKLHDRDVLNNATDIEEQEQWSVKIPKTDTTPIEGSVRVRKVTKNGKTDYTLTTKTPATVDGTGVGHIKLTQAFVETSVEVNKEMFEQFKMLATLGMVKTRHILPIEGTKMVYEVDSFKQKNGKFSEWVKIDLEVNSQLMELPKLPDEFKDVIYNQKGERTPEEARLVQRLYDDVFWLKNPFIK